MLYRIHFRARGAYWCIQRSTWGLFWSDVRRKCEGSSNTYEVLQYNTYSEAERAVETFGLNVAYQRTQGPVHDTARLLSAAGAQR